MNRDCRTVRNHIQERLDCGEGGLTDRDALHLQGCPACSGLLRGYSSFRRELRRRAEAASGADAPQWDSVFAAARGVAPRSAATVAGGPAGGGSGTAVRPPGRGVARHRPRLPVAMAAVLVLCLGVLVGHGEYRRAATHNFVRANTTEFVDTIFASSLFSASARSVSGNEADAGWFDATAELALPPSSSASNGAPGP